jgi:hypothetical protein
MYVTYNTTTGAISGWSNKSRTPSSGYAEVQSNDYIDQLHWYYDAATDTFSGSTDVEQSALDMQSLRSQRDALLAQSDWTQMPDIPLTDAKKQEWATYRQALRDLPANTTDPANPTWPTQPS